MNICCKTNSNWLNLVEESVKYKGFQIIENVLDQDFIKQTTEHMYQTQKLILDDIGSERLTRANELGVFRLMFKYNSFFFKFLEIPEVLAIVDRLLSPTAILHLQNGFILPSFENKENTPSVFQNNFHPDFPRYLNRYFSSINLLFTISDFNDNNGGTLVVPGTHQHEEPPSKEYCELNKIAVNCPAGSIIVFDSTLFHSAGKNISGQDRLGINHQFTRSYFKQQIDYVRALDQNLIQTLPEKTQQLLGYHTRVVTSLDEYYQPEEKRLYRKNQG